MVGPMPVWRPGEVFTVLLLCNGCGCSPPPLSTRRAIRDKKWSGWFPGSSSSSSESNVPLLFESECALRALSCPEFAPLTPPPLIPLLVCASGTDPELARGPEPAPLGATAAAGAAAEVSTGAALAPEASEMLELTCDCTGASPCAVIPPDAALLSALLPIRLTEGTLMPPDTPDITEAPFATVVPVVIAAAAADGGAEAETAPALAFEAVLLMEPEAADPATDPGSLMWLREDLWSAVGAAAAADWLSLPSPTSPIAWDDTLEAVRSADIMLLPVAAASADALVEAPAVTAVAAASASKPDALRELSDTNGRAWGSAELEPALSLKVADPEAATGGVDCNGTGLFVSFGGVFGGFTAVSESDRAGGAAAVKESERTGAGAGGGATASAALPSATAPSRGAIMPISARDFRLMSAYMATMGCWGRLRSSGSSAMVSATL